MHSLLRYQWLKEFRNQLSQLVAPISQNDDNAQKEYILNVFLVFLSALSILFFFSVVSLAYILGTSRNGISISTAFGMMIAFIGLLKLIKIGYRTLASWLFIGLFITPILYSIYRWGTLLPVPLVTLTLVILMTSILLGIRAAIGMALGLGSYLGLIIYAEKSNLIQVDTTWLHNPLQVNYPIELTIIFLIIVGVTWLAYGQIETSLRRARRSEAQAQRERDMLEERVEARTKQLKETQMEHMSTMVRFAEIGKLSAGFFHDMVNPLTAVSLYVNDLQQTHPSVEDLQAKINQAVLATDRLVDFTKKIRKEFSTSSEKMRMHLNTEIEQAVETVQYQANRHNVSIHIQTESDLYQSCNQLRFHRVIVNLLLNAIEACAENPKTQKREVTITLAQQTSNASIAIHDTGAGIIEGNIPYIFEPFFTTKQGEGLGLGLSIIKDIVTEELNAEISIKSTVGKGTSIIITWPLSS